MAATLSNAGRRIRGLGPESQRRIVGQDVAGGARQTGEDRVTHGGRQGLAMDHAASEAIRTRRFRSRPDRVERVRGRDHPIARGRDLKRGRCAGRKQNREHRQEDGDGQDKAARRAHDSSIRPQDPARQVRPTAAQVGLHRRGRSPAHAATRSDVGRRSPPLARMRSIRAFSTRKAARSDAARPGRRFVVTPAGSTLWPRFQTS